MPLERRQQGLCWGVAYWGPTGRGIDMTSRQVTASISASIRSIGGEVPRATGETIGKLPPSAVGAGHIVRDLGKIPVLRNMGQAGMSQPRP
jgi:hypothetical protein